MNERVARFYSSLKDKKVALAGLGVSHRELIKQMARKGIPVTVYDRKTRDQLDTPTLTELEELGVTLSLGGNFLEGLQADVLFRTPGMNWNMPELVAFRAEGGVVTSEMEVFFDLCPCEIIAVTGSDGKTTTSTLISELLRESGYTVHLGGNIGTPLLPKIEEIQPGDFAVVELSSFQLISMRSSPHRAVVTNITPNHLDVHAGMEEYIDAKRNIYLHQNAFSTTVLSRDNDIAASFAGGVRGRLRWFSLHTPVENGAYLDADTLMLAERGVSTPVMSLSDIRIPGIHNAANYLTAISAVGDLVSAEAMVKVARSFGGVEHRIEFVRERGGVKWYNDSIATSPTRSIAGLHSFEQKIVMLAGGYDKMIPFAPLAPEIIGRVKLLIVMGHTADKIRAAVREHPDYKEGFPEILRAESMEEAVRLADDNTRVGDIVSLSPACASFDCYPNFEARGRHFKELVNALD